MAEDKNTLSIHDSGHSAAGHEQTGGTSLADAGGKAERKKKRRAFFGKIPAFCMGLVLGGILVFGVMVSTIGLATIFPGLDKSPEINIFELEKTIEASSELTITKVHYADFVYTEGSTQIPTPLGDTTLPLTENASVMAYKGTIGLGFDIAKVKPSVDPESKTISIHLPEIEVLYDDFDNENARSFTVRDDVFSRDNDLEQDNELIGRIKQNEENSVRDNKATMDEARNNAEDVIRNTITGWDDAADYQVVFV